MTHTIHVEPAHANRQAFAKWALSQDPKIQTASATGSDVPVDLYPAIPAELLEGAYVDGYLYRGADPVPAVRADGSKPPEPKDAARPKQPQKRTQGRRKARPAATQGGQKDSTVQDVVLGEASQEGSDA